MPRKKKKGPAFERIAITLPPEVLAAADRLARRLDRSRSWVVAEAVRRFVQEDSSSPDPASLREPRSSYAAAPYSPGLGHLRLVQLEADLRLTPGERVRAAEEMARLTRRLRLASGEQVLCFDSPEDYLAWKQRDAVSR